MTTINLHQNQSSNGSNVLLNNNNNGLIFSVLILVLTLGGYFGLKYYVTTISAKTAIVEKEIVSQNEQLIGLDSLEKVVDSQKRLVEIKNNLQLEGNVVNHLEVDKILDKLSREMNLAVIATDFQYKNKTVTVTFEANGFSDIAKQVLSFKKSEYFSGAYLSSISRKEKKVNCVVVMQVAEPKTSEKK